MALTTMVRNVGKELPEKLNNLWDGMMGKLDDNQLKVDSEKEIQNCGM